MTSTAPTRGPVLLLAGLAALLIAAGVLPWVAGGSAAARGFATPLLLVGLFAGVAVLRASRPAPAPAQRAPAQRATSKANSACGGCQCGAGGCGQLQRNAE